MRCRYNWETVLFSLLDKENLRGGGPLAFFVSYIERATGFSLKEFALQIAFRLVASIVLGINRIMVLEVVCLVLVPFRRLLGSRLV